MAKTTREHHLKSNKWKTVASNYSFRTKHISLEVWAPRVASWRRVGVYPGFGRFRRFLSANLPFGLIQVKFRENRTCTVHISDSAEEVLRENLQK